MKRKTKQAGKRRRDFQAERRKRMERLIHAGYVPLSEIAGVLAISEQTVRNMCATGELRSSKVGAQFRVRREWWDAYKTAKGLGAAQMAA